MEYTIRGRCGQEGCRERRYYLDEGLWFCRQGHQQEVEQAKGEKGYVQRNRFADSLGFL